MAEELQEIEETDRHPIRFLLKLAVFVSLLYAAGRFLAQKKDEYSDLTESEARVKFMDKMAPRVGDEQAAEIADQVIPKLRERGLIRPDPMDAAADEVAEAVDKEATEAADRVSDEADSASKE